MGQDDHDVLNARGEASIMSGLEKKELFRHHESCRFVKNKTYLYPNLLICAYPSLSLSPDALVEKPLLVVEAGAFLVLSLELALMLENLWLK